MTNRTQRAFRLTWTLGAPPTDVFRAWTDPDHLQWFYNDGQPIPSEPIEPTCASAASRQRMVADENTA
jgi:uncharacterized protein YndB with AHSA1/START domain